MTQFSMIFLDFAGVKDASMMTVDEMDIFPFP